MKSAKPSTRTLKRSRGEASTIAPTSGIMSVTEETFADPITTVDPFGGTDHSCQYHTICIELCVKSSVSYRHIVSAHESYDTVCVSYESYCIVKLYVVRYIDRCFKV